MSESQAILLLGPTASGKTALALRLAEEIPSEIISLGISSANRRNP